MQKRLTATDADTVGDRKAVRISVGDAGGGVPPEFRERIFDKFFHVERHRPITDEGTRGVGIGLYPCRQIVALHRGTIRCDAGERGIGTKITLELPEHREDELGFGGLEEPDGG